MDERWVVADWPTLPGVRAAVSTRFGPGVSRSPYDRFNLGTRSGDAPDHVDANRTALQGALELPATPFWLQQIHGSAVVTVDASTDLAAEPRADAAVTRMAGRPLVILTADCLPVLLASVDGGVIGAAHAGWRGLAGGVLEATVAAMAPSSELLAWLGPSIGMASYEVGAEVRQAFLQHDPASDACFRPTRPGHWLCDLYGLARQRLAAVGVARIHGGGFDTFADGRFYSYRRDGTASGRFASVICRDAAP